VPAGEGASSGGGSGASGRRPGLLGWGLCDSHRGLQCRCRAAGGSDRWRAVGAAAARLLARHPCT
jgi:hypothetical protein